MNSLDSGFDLNLDTKQLSSENLHPIEYWEDEFDRTVLEAKKQCESDEQRAQLDNVIVELLFNLQEDNEVLDSELGSLIDTIYESVNILHIEEALSRMKASSNKKEVQTLLIDAVTTYSNSKKFILRQVVDFGEFYQAAVFDLFDKYRHEPRALKFFNEILFSEPEFVRSLFSIQDFVRMALFAVEEKGELEDKNRVLEVLYKEIELVWQFLFAKDGPMLVSEMKTASYGSPYRQIFMNVMQSLKSKRRLSPVNKRFIQELQETESRRLQEFIKSPESLLKNFNFYSFINYVGMVSKNLSGNALQEFQLKVLRTFDRPDYIVVLDRMLFALTKVEFLNGKSKDEYRQTFLSIVKLGIKQNILSSKVANLLYKHLHDYKFLAMSKDSFQGGVLTEFDGLSQNEDWIERQSWAKNGFNHVQAFSQIGASLDRVVGNSNSKELVITYPASGDHTSLIETVARGFNNSNLNLEKATIKLTEVGDYTSLIESKLYKLAQKTDVVSDVSEFVEGSENENLQVLNLKVLGKPVRIEFYFEAFDSTSKDDWYGYENLRASQMIVLHDLGGASLYSDSERRKIVGFVQHVSKHGLSQPNLDLNLNTERPKKSKGKASEDIITAVEFAKIVRSRDPDIDFTFINELLTKNPNGLTAQQNLDFYKIIRMSINEIDNLEERLKSIMSFVVKENQSKVVVMDYVSFREYKNETLFTESGVSFEVLDVDPGAIYGCDCNSLAHQGMAVVRLSPKE